MDASPRNADSAPPHPRFADVVLATDAIDEDDLALGWECANPALQIESWPKDGAAQPLS